MARIKISTTVELLSGIEISVLCLLYSLMSLSYTICRYSVIDTLILALPLPSVGSSFTTFRGQVLRNLLIASVGKPIQRYR